MLTDKMREVAEKALSFQRGFMADGENAMSHGYLETSDGKVIMMAFANDCMESVRTKNNLANFLMDSLLKHGGCIAFMSDTWKGLLPEGKTWTDMPADLNDWPAENRTEAVICHVNTMGQKGVMFVQEYTRDADNKPVWGPITYDESAVGRFIFDTTENKISVKMGGRMPDGLIGTNRNNLVN